MVSVAWVIASAPALAVARRKRYASGMVRNLPFPAKAHCRSEDAVSGLPGALRPARTRSDRGRRGGLVADARRLRPAGAGAAPPRRRLGGVLARAADARAPAVRHPLRG